MQISYVGKNRLKEREGYRDKAYQDSKGVWTIGYGTIKIDGKPVEAGMTCTREQAEQWLYADLAWAQTAVNKLVRVALAQHQFDALVSFVYNIGEANFATSTMLKKLNVLDLIGAGAEFPRWNKITKNGKLVVENGLTNRRLSEREQFEGQRAQ